MMCHYLNVQFQGQRVNENWNNLLPPSSTLRMEAAGSFVSLVTTYQDTECHMQEDHCMMIPTTTVLNVRLWKC